MQKEGEEPWETAETESRKTGFGEGRCLVQEVGRKGDAEGSRGQGQETRAGHWAVVQQHRDVGGGMAEGREVGWCEFVWFSSNLGRYMGLRGEGEVLRPAQLRVFLVCIFPSGWTGQVPPLGMWEGSWPALRGETEAGRLLSPCIPQFLGKWVETCSWFINIQHQQNPLMLH